MTFKEASEFVGKIKYKDGFRLLVYRDLFNQVEFKISWTTPDVNTGILGPLIQSTFIHEDYLNSMDEKSLVNLIRSRIRQMELHESDEWLTVAGIRMFDPHAVRQNPYEKWTNGQSLSSLKSKSTSEELDTGT